MSDFQKILKKALIHPTLSSTARAAFDLIGKADVSLLTSGEGAPQSSKDFAKIYLMRRANNYFGGKKVRGLNETIELLESSDRLVRLLYVQLEDALVSVWVGDDDSICGLLLFEK